MRYRNKPELLERLAAEYALGTLRGAARARFRRWVREDAALARTVAQWEGRLAPMAQGVAAVRPPRRVWDEIVARLGTPPAPKRRESLWKALALLASGAAAALVVMTVVVSPPAPQGEYVAVLSDPKTQRPALLVTAGRRDKTMRVKALDAATGRAQTSLEIWALPRDGKPRSLGLVPEGGQGTVLLAAVADQALSDVPALAVSLEPRGGSPTGAPTGPVLYAGPCVKNW